MNRTYLVTGGAGFIGSHIVEKLLENNYDVIIIDNLSSGSIENIPNSAPLKFYQLNIEKDDLELVFQKEAPNYVIHLAAQTSVNFSISHPYYDANMNVMASIKLLELCKKYNIRKFITASSAAIYGNPKYLPIDENHPTEPMSQYGLSKLTMEKYIKLSGIPYIIFRFSNAYGPRQKSSKESGVVAIFNNAMKNNEPINIYGDGEQIRDFIYVEDIANICIKAINSNVENEIINFSTNKGVSLNQLFKVMKSLYNYTLNANYLPERIGDIKNSILSNDKAYNLLKFTNYTKLEKGLEILANYID